MSTPSRADLPNQDDVEALRRRVAELEGELASARSLLEASRRREQMAQLVLDNLPMPIFWKGRDLVYLGGNRPFAKDAGVGSPADVPGKTDYEMAWARQHAEDYRKDDLQVMESGVAKLNYEEPLRQPEGNDSWVRTSKVPLRNEEGEVVAVLGMYEDITQRKAAEAKELARREEIIRLQAENLHALSNPLIPISDGAVALILIGAIDQVRADQIMETLLSGINAHGASIAIIDVTGVKVMDTSATSALVRAAKAARLLGARVVLTGISPSVAQALVHLGSEDLGGITTLRNLKAGIELALRG